MNAFLLVGGLCGRLMFSTCHGALDECFNRTKASLRRYDSSSKFVDIDFAWQPFKLLCQWLYIASAYSVAHCPDDKQVISRMNLVIDDAVALAKNDDSLSWLTEYMTRMFSVVTAGGEVYKHKPFRLTLLCRTSIRAALAENGHLFASRKLPLPQRLRDFIDLQVIV